VELYEVEPQARKVCLSCLSPFEGDPDVPLELSQVFASIYDSYYYALRIDYAKPVPPPELRSEMQAWLAEQAWQAK
jgi:hypothetical protein